MSSLNIKIKKQNRNSIYRCISRNGTVSIADISKELKLSLPTVSQNIEALKERGLIVENGYYKSSGGRRPKMVECNPRAIVAVGVDITAGHIRIVIVDLQGNIIDHLLFIRQCIMNEDYFEFLKVSIDDLLSKNKIPSNNVCGVGISLPAIIDDERKVNNSVFNTPLPENLLKLLQDHIPYPLDYFNDASSGGFAEFWNEKTLDNLFYLSLSETVGGSVMLQNRVWVGEDFRSAEIGHTNMIPGGKKCYCGQKGCVNAYCSSDNLSTLSEGNLDHFFELLEKQKYMQKKAWDTYLMHLTYAINNIHMLFDCHIIIGGYIGKYMPKYIERLKELVLEKDAFSREPNYISCCKYHLESSAVGAALIFIQDFIDKI